MYIKSQKVFGIVRIQCMIFMLTQIGDYTNYEGALFLHAYVSPNIVVSRLQYINSNNF